MPPLPASLASLAGSAASAEGAEQDAGEAAAAGEHPQALRSGRIRGGREEGPEEESDAGAGYGDLGDLGDVDDRRVLAARDLAGEDDENASDARVAAGLAGSRPAGVSSAGRALAC